jgi:hypothetical protein
MPAAVRELSASTDHPATVTVIVSESPKTFVAWGTVTWIDPLGQSAVTGLNAVGIDIPFVDGARTSIRAYGGDHLGAFGALSNLHESALVRFGETVTFRLRVFGPDLFCVGYAAVITNP